jgi:hypothetical protein
MSAACICFFAVHTRVARVVEHWVGAGVRGCGARTHPTCENQPLRAGFSESAAVG